MKKIDFIIFMIPYFGTEHSYSFKSFFSKWRLKYICQLLTKLVRKLLLIHQHLQVLQGRITAGNLEGMLGRLTEGEPWDHLQVFLRVLA